MSVEASSQNSKVKAVRRGACGYVPGPHPLLPSLETSLLGIAALGLGFSPYFGSTGYGYSFVLGILVFFTSAVGTALRLHSISSRRPASTHDVLRALASGPISLVGPLAASLAWMAFRPPCRLDVGLAWFLLLPAVSALFGSASGVFGARGAANHSRAVGRALIPCGAFLLLTLRDLLVDPPLFFFHPAFGYLPGPLYEEWIPIEPRLVGFRLWTAALSLWMAFPGRVSRNSFRHAWVLAGAALIVVLAARSEWGWFHPAGKIQKALGSQVTSERFRIFFDASALPASRAGHLLETLDYRAKWISRRLNLPDTSGRLIDVYLYASFEQKRRFTGTRVVLVGNPVARALHLYEVPPSSTILTHEVTHVLAAPLGLPGLGLPTRVGLLEGLATAMEETRSGLHVHEWARAMQRLERLPDITRTMGAAGFFREAPSRAYLAVGSFSLWLLDTFGPSRYALAYRGGSFEHSFGSPAAELVSRWESFLRDVPLTPYALAKAEPVLLASSVFERRCPHDVAAEIVAGHRCALRSDFVCAADRYERAFARGGKSLSDGLRAARGALAAGNWSRLESLIEGLNSYTSMPGAVDEALSLLDGDLAVVRGDLASALGIYSMLSKRSNSHSMSLEADARIGMAEAGGQDLLMALLENMGGGRWIGILLESAESSRFPEALLLAANAAIERRDYSSAKRALSRLAVPMTLDRERMRLEIDAETSEHFGDSDRAGESWKRLRDLARTIGEFRRADSEISRLKGLRSPRRQDQARTAK